MEDRILKNAPPAEAEGKFERAPSLPRVFPEFGTRAGGGQVDELEASAETRHVDGTPAKQLISHDSPNSESEGRATELAAASDKAIKWLKDVLDQPIDPECGSLMRAQASAAQTALNAQLRADETRLRAAQRDQALERLLAVIASREPLIPKGEGRKALVASIG